MVSFRKTFSSLLLAKRGRRKKVYPGFAKATPDACGTQRDSQQTTADFILDARWVPHKFVFPRRFAAWKRKFCGMTALFITKDM
jgi:hypothetical protein